MPQLDPSYYPTQLFWLAITFGLLFVVLWKIALPRISHIRAIRQSRIETDLEKAKAVRIEAGEVLKTYESSLAKATEEAQEIHHKVVDELSAERTKRFDEVNQSIADRIQKAETAIFAEEKLAIKEINSLSSELVQVATQQLGCGKTSIKDATTAVKAVLEGEKP